MLGPAEKAILNLQALADINEAIRLEPEELRHLSQRAWIYTSLDGHDAAERDLSEVIRRKANSRSYWERGHFFESTKKDFPSAIADYTAAIECAEREKAATGGYSEFPLEVLYQSRGQLYEKLGEPDKAAADFEKEKL